MEIALIIIGVIALAVVSRLIAGSFDGERVERYVRDMGCELIDRSWDPFGPGWFGEKESRIYEIVYRDREMKVHRAHVMKKMAAKSLAQLVRMKLVSELSQA